MNSQQILSHLTVAAAFAACGYFYASKSIQPEIKIVVEEKIVEKIIEKVVEKIVEVKVESTESEAVARNNIRTEIVARPDGSTTTTITDNSVITATAASSATTSSTTDRTVDTTIDTTTTRRTEITANKQPQWSAHVFISKSKLLDKPTYSALLGGRIAESPFWLNGGYDMGKKALIFGFGLEF